jgi:ferredoxin--NADP+ reductase
VGAAPIYPIARAYKHHGAKVIVIQGARSKQMLFWTERLAAVSDHHIITTDDGSEGRRGLVTDALGDILRNGAYGPIGRVYAIGPAIMMKCCADTTRPFGVPTIVSLNSIMIDGTGMCGGCRVEVGGKTLFTCADGPEFDGHAVNWEEFFIKQRTHAAEEKCLLQEVGVAPTQ